jgi:hypothetical protein
MIPSSALKARPAKGLMVCSCVREQAGNAASATEAYGTGFTTHTCEAEELPKCFKLLLVSHLLEEKSFLNKLAMPAAH